MGTLGNEGRRSRIVSDQRSLTYKGEGCPPNKTRPAPCGYLPKLWGTQTTDPFMELRRQLSAALALRRQNPLT